MGLKERRERERGQMRDRILATVCDVARADGWAAVTIRRIADEIEYSSPILYQYFDSKDAIIAQVRQDGFADLFQRMGAVPDSLPPGRRLAAMARENVNLGLVRPEVYQAMFGLGGAQIDNAKYPLRPTGTLDLVADAMRAVVAEGGDERVDIDNETTIMGAALHGLVSLYLNGLSGLDPDRLLGLAEHVAEDFARRHGVWSDTDAPVGS
ncbi:TetR/AcrR family transcriptional regulator [Amycolatopsis sp. NPDC051371]|uniref:TetR/AcrR family transcriptional regulator n=1 Tax=Amycolatopsis sp. NPDC051371 TaxID=3155800 RepID=UPI003420394C